MKRTTVVTLLIAAVLAIGGLAYFALRPTPSLERTPQTATTTPPAAQPQPQATAPATTATPARTTPAATTPPVAATAPFAFRRLTIDGTRDLVEACFSFSQALNETGNVRYDDYLKLTPVTKPAIRVAGDRRHIQSRDQAKSKIQNVKQKKEKQKNARDALKDVEPVAAVAVVQNVRLRFRRDQNPVYRVEQQWKKNAEYLDKKEIRHVVNVLDMIVEYFRSIKGGGIRVHVHEEKKPKRHDAGQLMEFSQQEGCAEFYRHCLPARAAAKSGIENPARSD